MSGLVALALVAGAAFVSCTMPRQLGAAPVDLAVPQLDPSQLGQWCVDRKAQGTAGLSLTARQWLRDCVALFGGGLTSSPTPSPSATQTASPSPSPTVQPSSSDTPTATTPPATTPPATTPPPSPSPSPSPTGPGLLTDCFSHLAECGYPTTSSTGVPPFAPMAAYTGPATITVPGTVIEGKTLGCVAIAASNVVIRNSKITGPCFYGIDMQSGSLLIEDSEVSCVDGRGTGIAWAHFAAVRVYIHDCENAAEMGEGSSVEDSYLSAREATSDGHGDDIQSQGGNNVIIRHNTFAGTNPITSSIITNPTLNNGWTIVDNLLSSGAYTLYCPEQGIGFVVQGNRFYPAKTGNPHSASYGLTDACDHPGITWSSNYRDSDLSVVSATA